MFTLLGVLGPLVALPFEELLHLLPMPLLFFGFFWASKLTAQVRGAFVLWHNGGAWITNHSFLLDSGLLPGFAHLRECKGYIMFFRPEDFSFLMTPANMNF